MTPDPAVTALILAASDHADLQLKLRLEAFREGWRACEQAQGDAYRRGVYDGAIARKRAEHLLVTIARLQAARYGPRSRQATDPRPEDFPGLLMATGDGAT